MNNRRNALGRGLSAILKNPKTDITNNTNNEKLVATINEISIDEIQINPFQPRVNFEEEKYLNLQSQ